MEVTIQETCPDWDTKLTESSFLMMVADEPKVLKNDEAELSINLITVKPR